MDLTFTSRRSVRLSRHAAVSCDNPFATEAGISILKKGGNAADAAVAVAAALNVTQPTTTGVGGDAFCIFYSAKDNKVHGINGSGRTPGSLTLDMVRGTGYSTEKMYPETHGFAVTVPGAPAAWVDTFKTFGSGKLSLNEILEPGITLAEEGFPVSDICADAWKKGSPKFTTDLNTYGCDMLINGHAPKHGQIWRNPKLANTFRELAKNGKSGFYEGMVGAAIVDAIQHHGGVMTPQDLVDHHSTFEDPLSTSYKGVRLWELGPNGQGIIALMALNILENFDISEYEHNSPEYLHLVAEALRLAFADGYCYIGDPARVEVPVEQMLCKTRAKSRANIIQKHCTATVKCDSMGYKSSGDTTYFSVVDSDGNACSFINSKFHGFGSGIVPKDCGFTLQDRGSAFNLTEGHPNCIAPNKRPFHTIIPAMLTSDNTGELLCSYGIMGGYTQPQAHVQVLLNMLEFGMDPQRALDAPRISLQVDPFNNDYHLWLEESFGEDTVKSLEVKGHARVALVSSYARSLFGRGHVISVGSWWAKTEDYNQDPTDRVLWTGTDGRSDGLAGAY